MGVLSNDWVNWLFSNYSIVIMGIPSVIAFILKLVAIYHPNVHSNEVVDVFKEYWPGQKEK